MPDEEITAPVENEETNTETETEPETIETGFDLFTAVSTVLLAGLDADYWSENVTKQNAAFHTACGDIFARLSGVKPEDVTEEKTNIIYAIAEQAVYLLRHYGEQTTGQQKASESVDGLSIAYSSLVTTNADGIISPRALAYLQAAIAENRGLKAAKIRFVRG